MHNSAGRRQWTPGRDLRGDRCIWRAVHHSQGDMAPVGVARRRDVEQLEWAEIAYAVRPDSAGRFHVRAGQQPDDAGRLQQLDNLRPGSPADERATWGEHDAGLVELSPSRLRRKHRTA